MLILTSLASGPKHGYGLLQDIEAFAGVRLGPGTLYGAIGRLEDQGLIEAIGEAGRRRPYRLNAAGTGALETTLAGLRTIVEEGTARLAGNSQSARCRGGRTFVSAAQTSSRLVRLYSEAVRVERYGQEMQALIVESSGEHRVSWRMRVDVARGAGREQLRSAGLADNVHRATRSALACCCVLCAWALFVIGGIPPCEKFSEALAERDTSSRSRYPVHPRSRR